MATNIYDSGGSLGGIICTFSCFVCCAECPTNLLPKFLQFITPCLVAEILKFHLRQLMGFGGRKVLRSCLARVLLIRCSYKGFSEEVALERASQADTRFLGVCGSPS